MDDVRIDIAEIADLPTPVGITGAIAGTAMGGDDLFEMLVAISSGMTAGD